MFKEITSISKNYAFVKIVGTINDDILNYNVIFEEANKKILGEIEEIIDDKIKITFLGEFINDKFFSGIIRKPSLSANVRLINQSELNELVGLNDMFSMKLGTSPLYNNYSIMVNIDKMFSNYSAIFGNTGSGKTCVAFCQMMKIPMIVKMELPDPEPHSSNAKIYERWIVDSRNEKS